MNAEPRPTAPPGALSPPTPPPRRLFLFESGWGIALKVGSERVFCYAMAPGQDFYHRLMDGEIFLQRADERLCLACAERRGLIAYEPRMLGEALWPLDADDDHEPRPGPVLDSGRGFDVIGLPEDDEDEYEDE